MNKSKTRYHVWLRVDYKYYDSECVDGVNNLFKLPFFERSFSMYADIKLYIKGDI